MANYRPIISQVTAGSADSGVIVPKNLTQTSWGLFLLKGTVKFSNTTLHSAAVNVWESTTATGTPEHITFTDNTVDME